MLLNGNLIKEIRQYDICIVGGGVAGIVLACELVNSGKKVALIESGGEQFDRLSLDLNQANSFPPYFPDPHYSRLRYLGGSSNHWQNNTSPFSPIDFKAREGIEHSGWPIDYSEINDYYTPAQEYCGVGQDGYSAEYWSSKLGLKLVTNLQTNLESRVAKAALPPTRFFTKHGHKLVNSTNIDIITHSTLIDIDYSKDQNSVDTAYFSTHEGNSFSIKAAKFVLALGGIENARMLLHFNQKYESMLGNAFDNVGRYFMEHPTPRAAQLFSDTPELFEFYNGKVFGERYIVGFLSLSDKLVEENQTVNLRMPLLPQTNYTLSDGISSFHVLTDSFSNGEWPEFAGQHMLNMITDWDMVAEAISRKKFNKKMFDNAGKIGGFQVPMMMEQTPNFNNAIKLSNSVDKFGIPKVNINYEISPSDKTRVWRSLELVAKEVGITGIGRLKTLQERSSRIWSDQLGYSNHHMGTTKMSNSPENGVVDKNLKVHGTRNLYIAGSSIFPTGGHVPPTLTIAAFSVRLAEHLV